MTNEEIDELKQQIILAKQENKILKIELAKHEVENSKLVFKNENLSGAEIASIVKSDKNIFKTPKKKFRNMPCPCGSGKKYKKCCFYSKQLR